MSRRSAVLSVCVALVLVSASGRGDAQGASGYLPAGSFDILKILPPAPKAGSPADEADKQTYLATRALQGSPRWALAASDADYTPRALVGDFSCAIGAELDPKALPKLMAIYSRLGPDLFKAVDASKSYYKRPRPYLSYGGEICVEKSDGLAKSPDYASGHATLGWTMGLILAELAPDRAQDVLARGRAFAESRAVCGVHSASAVVAGETTAAALVGALHGQAAFRADLDAARGEMESFRKTAAKPALDCSVLKALVETSPY